MFFGTEEERAFLTTLFGAAQGRELSLHTLHSMTSTKEDEKEFRDSIIKLMDKCIEESHILGRVSENWVQMDFE